MLKWIFPWFYLHNLIRETIMLKDMVDRRNREISQLARALEDCKASLAEQAKAAAYYASKTPKRGKGGKFVASK